MKAMVLDRLYNLESTRQPLTMQDIPKPVPAANEILLQVFACGVCHTELDEIEGRTLPPRFPIVLGHQVVGRIEAMGKQVTEWKIGDRVGIAWIFSACGHCRFCLDGKENLCPAFTATGRDVNGGYAQYILRAATTADF